jgi:hypothetical protein
VAKKLARRRRRKVTPEEAKLAHKQLTALLAQELPNQGMKLGLSKWRQRRLESEKFAAKQYAKWQAAGGEEGTGKPFVEWLKSVDWKAVIEFIMKLVATFGAVA